MSDYIKTTDFATKDGLLSGDPLKIVSGTELDDEYNALQTAVNSKANINSPQFTGTPLAPTAVIGSNSTQVATTAYVKNVLANSPVLGGSPTLSSVPSQGDNSNKLATTSFVKNAFDSNTSIITADYVKLNSVYFGQSTSGWRMYQSGTSLYFSYNGTVRMRLESSGRLYCENDIGAFVSL